MVSAPLIFFHIPKTGGLTLAAIMLRQYPPGSIFDLWLQRPETFSGFEALTEEERMNLRGLTGHMPFGYHGRLAPGARYVTMLRNPEKRLVSEFWHLRQDPADWGAWQAPPSALESLDAYVDYLAENHMADAQTRLLSGYLGEKDRPPLVPMPDDALEQAKQNLVDHVAVAGLTERFDESLVLMKREFGWSKPIYHLRRNVRAQKQQKAPIAEETVARIAALTRNDTELVAFAEERLDEQIRACRDELEKPLRKLRRMNAVIQAVGKVLPISVIIKIRSVPGIRQASSMAMGIVNRFT